MTDVYSNAPMFKSATIQLAQYLRDLLFNLGTQREIKVLEIGVGTGGTTNYLVQELAAVPGLRFQYKYTDISSYLATLVRKRFKAYNFMRYTTLEIENDPSPDLPGKYDIIISMNCIYATRNLITSCTNIRRLLRPQGNLCLIELAKNLFWFDFGFGLLEGWRLFNDGWSHALAHERHWDHNLRQAGFSWVNWTDNDSAESDILRLIVASSTQTFLALEGEDEPKADCSTVREQTVLYNTRDDLELFADIYYPKKARS
ncbi:class I SAM-dependent methyltransferase [Aspergillus foveolatus]|uniref:class I SAM-dependent methyltransferase n=1 Tax=Aspergillus foveolatus TaxID=210207 RepID=UPI003CCE4E03